MVERPLLLDKSQYCVDLAQFRNCMSHKGLIHPQIQIVTEMSSSEAAKKRILPAWMTKNAAEPEEWAKMRSKRRKKTALARTETVYCMNEAELVDMALCILAENCKAIEGEVISSEDKVQEHQQELRDGHHPRTAISIAKDLPVPSTPPNQSASLSSSEETKLEEDDDALKYVREIFFT